MTQRSVLIVEDKSSIRNLIYTLLSTLGCDGEVAHSGQQALAMIARHPFDAVLLDLRSLDLTPEQMLSGILEIRPNLMGRVLIITGEVADEKTLNWIEQKCFLRVPRGHLVSELWSKLRTLWDTPVAPYPLQHGSRQQ